MTFDYFHSDVLYFRCWKRCCFWAVFCGLLCLLNACRQEVLPPEVDFPEGLVYRIKVADTLCVAPVYIHAGAQTLYCWSLDGQIVSEEPVLQFIPMEAGRFYISLSVQNEGGEVRQEIRVDVSERAYPLVSLPMVGEEMVLAQHDSCCLQPMIESDLPCRYRWSIDGNTVSEEACLWFPTSRTGSFEVDFRVENADGADGLHFTVRVLPEDEIALSWTLPPSDFSLCVGRCIRLCPMEIRNGPELLFRWSSEGEMLQEASHPAYVFEATATGDYPLCLEMSNGRESLFWTPTVHVSAPPQPRLPSAASQSAATLVFSYLPAPGQFINDGYDCRTMEDACRYAEERMRQKQFVSLGGFGGSLVLGFDHSIVNDGHYNLAVRGNAFVRSSEPAVVWVMQDENGNGLPDDTWYELKGSEYGGEGYVSGYAVRYYRPSERRSVPWTDSEGRQGLIPYQELYHAQPSYYPAWVTADDYVLYGSRLGARNRPTDDSELQWTNEDYAWGYADNYSLIDMMAEDGSLTDENHFRISDAVRFDGQSVELPFIDFVRIQSAVNAVSGWLGEVSSEVVAVYDYNLQKQHP